METYIDFLLKYPLEEKAKQIENVRYNLTKLEWIGIKNLKKNNDLVIKESDKGGACVIMDAGFYCSKMQQILEDKDTYKKLDTNIDKQILKKIENLTKTHEEELTEKEINYLTNFNCKTSQLYGLPKVHKSKRINEQIQKTKTEYISVAQPQDLSFRPIIAGPVCITSRLSDFLDILLKPYVVLIKSYIRDDIDFLDKIQRDINVSETLLTFDVTSMYTNIDNELGKEAITYWVTNHPNQLLRNISKEFIIKALAIVLECNAFTFDTKNYIQIRGTAMGTKVAPTYATLVMGFLEIKLYKQIEEKYGIDIKTQFVNKWWRYLDDCFLIWDTRIDSSENLLSILQGLHLSIKFTAEESKKEISFLDIKIIIEDNKIVTDLYQKPTDSQQYVHFKSCHPWHTKRNIPFNLARRYCTIIEKDLSKNEKLKSLKSVLIKQGYPSRLVDSGIQKAKSIPLEELRQTKQKENTTQPLAFVTTHNPRNPDMFQVIKNTISLLDASPKMKRAMEKVQLINSKRQPPSIKQMLTKARFVSNTANLPTHNNDNNLKVTKCNNKRCGTCSLIFECNEIKFKNSDKPFIIKSRMDCTAMDIVYLIRCTGCDKEYIGETSNLRARVRVHKQQTLDPRLRHLYVNHHIAHCAIGKTYLVPNNTFFLNQPWRQNISRRN